MLMFLYIYIIHDTHVYECISVHMYPYAYIRTYICKHIVMCVSCGVKVQHQDPTTCIFICISIHICMHTHV